MEDTRAIEAELAVLAHLGYSEAALADIVSLYSGHADWPGLSVNQKRRLAVDLKKHAAAACRWHFALLTAQSERLI